MTTFFRLLHTEDKDAALRQELAEPGPLTFEVEPEKFALVPGSPFAYWVSDRIRKLFKELPPFESDGRTVKQGLATADDFRFVRCWWEVAPGKILDGGHGPDWRTDLPKFQAWCKKRTFEGKRWVPLAKGGVYSPFHADLQLVVNWERDGEELRDFAGSVIRNPNYYFRPGLTWPMRPHKRGAFSNIPPGCLFSHTGPMLFTKAEAHWSICALLCADPYILLLHMLMPRGSSGGQTLKYELGYISSVPIPVLNQLQADTLERYAISGWRIAAHSHSESETSKVYSAHSDINDSSTSVENVVESMVEICLDAYGITAEDRTALTASQPTNTDDVSESDDEAEPSETVEIPVSTNLASYAVGCVLGRWDVRYATGEKPAPSLPDPFDPLPVCSPGMLQGENGLPLLEAPTGYPLAIDRDGILVDDPDHADDILRRIEDVYDLLKKPRDTTREYFRKPGKGGFWDDHVSRYSKSRRKAPIYWLLQSKKKNYAVWLYYHRLDKDLLFKVLLNYVEPKIRLEASRLESLRSQKAAAGESGKEAKRLAKDVERQEDFLSELRDFEDKLRRAANLHLEPDLNDGVVLNIAPLWELVPWKEAKSYWDELLAGRYEWSSIGKQLRQKGLVS